MILPASAIMYASGSTDNSEGTSDGEFSENSSASDSGSTDNSEAHQIASSGITSTHHQIVGLLMIMLIYQQRQRKIIPLYQVNLR